MLFYTVFKGSMLLISISGYSYKLDGLLSRTILLTVTYKVYLKRRNRVSFWSVVSLPHSHIPHSGMESLAPYEEPNSSIGCALLTQKGNAHSSYARYSLLSWPKNSSASVQVVSYSFPPLCVRSLLPLTSNSTSVWRVGRGQGGGR